MKKEIICILAIFQIILLVNAIIAHPYIINEAQKSVSENSISEKEKDITKKTILLLTGILSIKQIGTVSASSFSSGCCPEMENGAICENIPIEDADKCKNTLSLYFIPTDCDQVDSCRLGCCFNPSEGTCTSKTPKGKCEEEGGEWDSEINCRIESCQRGCCLLGSSAQFTTEKNCEKLSTLYGFKKDFKDIKSEVECLSLSKSQPMGACMNDGGGCSFKTEKECAQIEGKFYKDFLCSHPSLETSCTKQASVGCIDGRDEIYWLDSCGNMENIYSSDRNASWNDGKVLIKEASCNPNLPNINSTTCGNCDRFKSSVCAISSDKKIEDGDFVCESLECLDSQGKARQNGESWCVYESYIGEGKDVVGSEHWRAFCNKGIVELDMCGDYRGRICVQSTTESRNKTISTALCAPNTATACLGYNGEKDVGELCSENEYCVMKEIKIASGFSFNFCSPKYPKGLGKNIKENKEICELATKTCKVIYVRDHKRRWVCRANCECETAIFAKQMNEMCTSLGDCGTYVNYVGKGTNNVVVSGSPSIKWQDYVIWAVPVLGQFAAPSKNDKTIMGYESYSTKYSEGSFEGGWTTKNFAHSLLGGGISITIVVMNLFGWGKKKTVLVTFKCLPWQAPLGGDDCEKCDEDPMKPCTEYRCKSLGQACVLLNEWTEKPICRSAPKDNSTPVITPGGIEEGYKFEETTNNQTKVVGETLECINEFTPVLFNLTTDKFAQCIYSFFPANSIEFDDMEELNYPEEAGTFTKNHTFSIFVPSLDSLSVYELEGDLKEMFGKISMYVRCQDYWGNYNVNEYAVNFCIHSGPDVSPVNHNYTSSIPGNGGSLRYGTNKTDVAIYTNEPAECKYSYIPEQDYESMENLMTCQMELEDVTDLGWECKTSIGAEKDENKIYIKCKDQPWLAGTINETNRNINNEDYLYILYSSKSELKIEITSPLGVVRNGFEPISVDLGVRTSGGAKDGIATCYWGTGLNIPFWETGSTIHRQTLNTIRDGIHSIPIKCQDVGNNIATTEINFTAKLDREPPIVVRAYKEGANLVLFTDEKAECYYTYESCDFDTSNGNAMTTALSTVHKSSWEHGKTYYIKCKDTWANTNPWCAMKVTAA